MLYVYVYIYKYILSIWEQILISICLNQINLQETTKIINGIKKYMALQRELSSDIYLVALCSFMK